MQLIPVATGQFLTGLDPHLYHRIHHRIALVIERYYNHHIVHIVSFTANVANNMTECIDRLILPLRTWLDAARCMFLLVCHVGG
jgi:hypothetical protein